MPEIPHLFLEAASWKVLLTLSYPAVAMPNSSRSFTTGILYSWKDQNFVRKEGFEFEDLRRFVWNPPENRNQIYPRTRQADFLDILKG